MTTFYIGVDDKKISIDEAVAAVQRLNGATYVTAFRMLGIVAVTFEGAYEQITKEVFPWMVYCEIEQEMSIL